MNAVQEETIIIEKIISGGGGIGRLNSGMVMMLPGVLPGEKVRCRVKKSRKNHLEGRLSAIIVPAPGRIVPACPHYGICGGCDFQHINYPTQLELKKTILWEHLVRAGLLNGGRDIIWEEPVPSPEVYHYRQRIRMKVDRWGRPGFLMSGSHTIVPVKHCLLARQEVNRLLGEMTVNPGLAWLLEQSVGLELAFNPGGARVTVSFELKRRPRPALLSRVRGLFDDYEQIVDIYLIPPNSQRLGPFSREAGAGEATELLRVDFEFPAVVGLPPYSLKFEPGGFCQINLEQNVNLVKQLLNWAGLTGREQVLDLFCGMGNFSIPLARLAGGLVGMDLQRSAIRSAGKNAAAAGLQNCQFHRVSAEAGIRKLAAERAFFDLLLLDPPRRGCREIIPEIVQLGSPRLIYISCDPATLSRDLADLTKNGYEILRICPFDMFPQTSHLETMVELALMV